MISLKGATRVKRALRWMLLYAAWVAFGRLVGVTVTVYLSRTGTPRLQELGDAVAAAELGWMGWAAFSFALALRATSASTYAADSRLETLRLLHYARRIGRGAITGLLVATLFCGVLAAVGAYDYVGSSFQLETLWIQLGSSFLRVTSLLMLVAAEEKIFRERIEGELRGLRWAPLGVAVAYVGVKALQFDLGWTQSATLAMASVAFSLRAGAVAPNGTAADADSAARARDSNAGIAWGFLTTTQVLFSLPVLGSEFQGLWMLAPVHAAGAVSWVTRWLTGGIGGPLSSALLQLLLLGIIAKHVYALRTRVRPPSPRLRAAARGSS